MMRRTSLWIGAVFAGVVEATAISWSIADPAGGWATWRVALAAWPIALALGTLVALIVDASE